ncbi:MAG: anthranilate phosphoribosyltransferase [Actinobacteria bacterium]|nr:anthranilate phosphoribosyltransferase [Actinomycetota bacterium]
MPNGILTRAIDGLAAGHHLSSDHASAVLREVMEGRSSEVETAAFLIALRTKGETVDEVAGLARTMRELATPVDAGVDGLVDTAGTGGGTPTFNVSTAAALVAAGAGCTVAKHGNRSATGRSGSADVIEALGARIDLEPGGVADCIRSVGFGFMFAPSHHAAMRHVVPVRRELAVRTIFNFLGPLTNPAGATRQLIGVADAAYLETLAAALEHLGSQVALVVAGDDGVDEVSACGPTHAVELRDGRLRPATITPEQLGVERIPSDALRGCDPEESARCIRSVLDREERPERSIVLMNAAAAIYVAGRAESLEAGARAAEEAIDSGAARDALDRFVARTRELGPE